MALATPAILQITHNTASGWYTLTDHNRQPLDISYENIEKSARMADGSMRKYVIAQKRKYSTSWNDVPVASGKDGNGAGPRNPNAGYYFAVDGNYAMGWLKEFYENYVFQPVYIKVFYGQETSAVGNSSWSPLSPNAAHSASTAYTPSVRSAGEQVSVFMTNFSYNIKKRYTLTDIVDVTIEFTEI